MRILYCNKYNFPFSGTEVYLFELMEMMRAHGHEVALFSMADPRGEPTPYDSHFAPHIDFKAGGHGPWRTLQQAAHAIYSRGARKRLRRMIDVFRPDVAHIRNIYHHLSPSILWELKAQLDAMGAGVCVLASDVPENREAVESAGFTFQHGNVDDLQRMLRLLISDARLRETAAVKGRERVREHYLWDEVAKQVEAVYLELLKDKLRTSLEPIVKTETGQLDRAA